MPELKRRFTRDSIKTYVKESLGYPTVEVELTDSQLDICIDNALDEVSDWVVERQFVTLPVQERIDLTNYRVSYVINVHKSNGSSEGTNQVDVFNPGSSSAVVIGTSGTIGGLAGMGGCGYQIMRETNYARLEQQLYGRLVGYTKDNISFKYIKPYLYLDIGVPAATYCTIEYSPIIEDLESINERLYQNFVRKFSLAYGRKILSEIRGKYEVAGAPISLDGDKQNSKADDELAQLRSKLNDTAFTQFPID